MSRLVRRSRTCDEMTGRSDIELLPHGLARFRVTELSARLVTKKDFNAISPQKEFPTRFVGRLHS